MVPGYVIILGIIGLIVVIIIARSIHFVPVSEAWVVEKIGEFDTIWTAGLHFKVPFIQSVVRKVSLKELNYDVPPQNVITKDNVTVSVDAYMLFNIFDVKKFAYKIQIVSCAMDALCVSALRDIIGKMDLEECLTSRDLINRTMTQWIDEAANKWGIKVTLAEIKTFTPPIDVMEAMKSKYNEDKKLEALLFNK